MDQRNRPFAAASPVILMAAVVCVNCSKSAPGLDPVTAEAETAVDETSNAAPVGTVDPARGEVTPRAPWVQPRLVTELLALACAGRASTCRLHFHQLAGTDALGRTLLVLAVDPFGQPAPDSSNGGDGDDESDDESDVDDADRVPKEWREYWVGVVEKHDGQSRLLSGEKVYEGGFTTGEPDLRPGQSALKATIGPNRLTVSETLRISSSHRSSITSWQLHPWRLLDTSMTIEPVVGEATWHEVRNRRALRMYVEAQLPLCDHDGQRPGRLHAGTRYRDVSALGVPTVTLDLAYRNGGWRDTAMDECALHVTDQPTPRMRKLRSVAEQTSGPSGFIIHGKPDTADDSSIKVVMAHERSLFIEIRDDTWVTKGAKSWLYEDHIEIWLGPYPGRAAYRCIPDKRSQELRQWAILVGSGRVIPAYGKPSETLGVEHVPGTADGPARMKIELPPRAETDSITIVYSDSDDGWSQEHLLATSALRFGHAQTLGPSWPMNLARPRCRVRDGRLHLELTAAPR